MSPFKALFASGAGAMLESGETAHYIVGQPLLTVSGLHVRYGDNVILRDVNFEIRDLSRPDSGVKQGQVVALLAPSGMGKTQLFNCIAGIQKPTEGSVLLMKCKKPVKIGMVGVVEQKYPLIQHRTILGNLILPAMNAGMGKAEAKEAALEFLEHFKLAHVADRYPTELSGGQQQRIAIAQQVLAGRHILLMDEPFSGLDVLVKRSLVNLIGKIAQRHEHQTMIITTHDTASALAIADRVLILGRERNEKGEPIPGAFLKYDLDLITEGLAWHKDIVTMPRFRELMHYIEDDVFPML